MRRLLAAAFLVAAPPVLAAPGWTPLEITARPIEEFTIDRPATLAGTLTFMGGLSLSSPNRDFGALSGMEILPDGTVLFIADTGHWLSARLVEEGGRLVGVADARMAPILDAAGDEANQKGAADAEGLRLAADRRSVLVSFEGDHRIMTYPLGDLAFARPVEVPRPAFRGLSGNRGIEAVAVAPVEGPLAGAIVAFSEQAADGNGGLRAWVLGGPRDGQFAVRRNGQFDITDAAFLPNGDLFVLERQFSLSEGIAMRIRRLAAADLRPGATVDGPVVLVDDHLFQIDNMEGMALRPQPDGSVVITIVSDNNHSLLQRNLLLQFRWEETAVPLPRERP
ncbi:MAG: esterase-like activity of phytase family protein [Bauldia sp.]|nr:esterase-like activity of phytase family protein [Bauldia sp.]